MIKTILWQGLGLSKILRKNKLISSSLVSLSFRTKFDNDVSAPDISTPKYHPKPNNINILVRSIVYSVRYGQFWKDSVF